MKRANLGAGRGRIRPRGFKAPSQVCNALPLADEVRLHRAQVESRRVLTLAKIFQCLGGCFRLAFRLRTSGSFTFEFQGHPPIGSVRASVRRGQLPSHFDPHDGRVLGQREAVPTMEFSRRNIANTVYTLHYNLFLGDAGSTLVGCVGLFALVSTLSGVVLWWPRGARGWARALRVKRRARGVRLHFDLHRVAAVYSVAVLAAVAFTGVTLTFGSQTRTVLDLLSTVRRPPPDVLPPRPQAPVDADRVLARAAAEFPGSRVRCLWLPQASGPAWRITLAEPGGVGWAGGSSELWLHPADASLVDARRHGDASAAEAYLAWQLPLHNGRLLGLPGRIAVFVLGFVPVLLSVTGVLIWWRKRRARDIGRSRIARPALNRPSS